MQPYRSSARFMRHSRQLATCLPGWHAMPLPWRAAQAIGLQHARDCTEEDVVIFGMQSEGLPEEYEAIAMSEVRQRTLRRLSEEALRSSYSRALDCDLSHNSRLRKRNLHPSSSLGISTTLTWPPTDHP